MSHFSLSAIVLAALLLAGCNLEGRGTQGSSVHTPVSYDPPAVPAPVVERPTGGGPPSPEAILAAAQEFATHVGRPSTRPAQAMEAAPAASVPQATVAELPLPNLTWLHEGPGELRLTWPQADTPPAPAPAPPQPAVPPPYTPVGAAPAALEAELERRAREFPRDLASQLDLQLLQLLRGAAAPQMEAIAALPREDRELLAAVIDALANLRSNARSEAAMLAAQKARPLVELGDRIRARSDLRVGSMALCTRVDGFGVYQAIDADRLPAGREHALVLYCEVENFLPRRLDNGQWETNLTQETVLYDPTGRRVWSLKPQEARDVCRNQRRDFFLGQRLTIPSSLAPGAYTLRVTLIDQNSNRVAEGTLPLRLTAEAARP
jgi:hypothetical protein